MNIVKFTIHSLILIITLCVILFIMLGRFTARWKDRLKANALIEPPDILFEEGRQDSGLRLNIPVVIDTSEKRVAAETKSITSIGAFIVCKNPLPVKKTFRITFLFPDHNPLVFDAEVVWSNSNLPESRIVHRGMGIRFIKPSNENREFLRGVLTEAGDGESIGDSASDEAVIELIEIVEFGETAEESESEEIARLSDGEADQEKQLPFEAGLSRDSRVESEALHAVEPSLEETVEAAGTEKATPDIPRKLPNEDPAEVVSTFKGQPETEAVVASCSAEELIGISEERIEAIITKAVQVVVERVVRETMATVAKRVITESIDALKASLAPPQS